MASLTAPSVCYHLSITFKNLNTIAVPVCLTSSCAMKALDPGQLEVLSELAEVQQLAQQEISRRVGLPGLKISEDPGTQL